MTAWDEVQAELRAELQRLVSAAHDETGDVHHRTSAVQLYRDAAQTAERSIPGPLGTALAGVLVKEGYERSLHRMSGCLGAERTMLSLALAALDHGADGAGEVS